MLFDYECEDYKKTNREKSQETNSGFYWCNFCDACKVANGSKCKNCGKKEKTKKFRK